jgi:hypothetical protein
MGRGAFRDDHAIVATLGLRATDFALQGCHILDQEAPTLRGGEPCSLPPDPAEKPAASIGPFLSAAPHWTDHQPLRRCEPAIRTTPRLCNSVEPVTDRESCFTRTEYEEGKGTLLVVGTRDAGNLPREPW